MDQTQPELSTKPKHGAEIQFFCCCCPGGFIQVNPSSTRWVWSCLVLPDLTENPKIPVERATKAEITEKSLEAVGDGADPALGHLNSHGNSNILSLKSGNPVFPGCP